MESSRPAAGRSFARPLRQRLNLFRRTRPVADRLMVDADGAKWRHHDALAGDVKHGLLAPQKWLPPKYFYDDRGSRLFDRICELPEYYLTRTEQALLEATVDDIVELTAPDTVVEFGSGASRKTRAILSALSVRRRRDLSYVPIDVSEGMLRRAANALLREYPRLCIHAVVGDYERDLHRIPPAHRRLVLFLGSTIGNLTPAATACFLSALRRQLVPRDHFLLGVDLLKPVEILEAAYNDGAGVTAEFNRNVLRVINVQLDADFDPEAFAHVAFFNHDASAIEMHLRARRAHTAHIRQLGLDVHFAEGETIHTESSRKFTRDEVTTMLAAAGFRLTRWYTPADNVFGLALAKVM